MVWQDYVMGGVGLFFGVSIFPEVLRGFKEKKQTMSSWSSLGTALGLYVLSYTQHTLDLDLAAFLTGITATEWGALFYQRRKYNNGLGKNLEGTLEEEAKMQDSVQKRL